WRSPRATSDGRYPLRCLSPSCCSSCVDDAGIGGQRVPAPIVERIERQGSRRVEKGGEEPRTVQASSRCGGLQRRQQRVECDGLVADQPFEATEEQDVAWRRRPRRVGQGLREAGPTVVDA